MPTAQAGIAAAITLTLTLSQGATAAGKEYVDGLGWLPTAVVSNCLRAAGEGDTDALHDESWEEFLACVGDHRQ
jgi:hypothetical protein